MSEYAKTVVSSVVTMLFMSVYTTVDGMFASRYVSTDAMAAINICYPIVNVMFAIGFGLAIGGSTRIAYAAGKGDREEADRQFTLLIRLAGASGLFMIAVLLCCFNPLLRFLGATERIMQYCRIYAGIAIIAYPVGIYKEVLTAVMRTQRMSGMSMFSSVTGGVCNIILDDLFIRVFGWGVAGAGIATVTGMLIALLINISCFLYRKEIHFVRLPTADLKEAGQMLKLSVSTGIMELSYAVITWTFNQLSMKYENESGVAAFTVIGYIQYALSAVFIGIGNGITPFLSMNYGAKDTKEQSRVLKKSFGVAIGSGLAVTAAGYFFSGSMVSIFLHRNTEIFEMAKTGIDIIAFSYLPMGVNITAVSMLNSCGRGKDAALFTFFRTVVFLVGPAVVLSPVWELRGIWISYVLTEVMMCLGLVFVYLKKQGQRWNVEDR